MATNTTSSMAPTASTQQNWNSTDASGLVNDGFAALWGCATVLAISVAYMYVFIKHTCKPKPKHSRQTCEQCGASRRILRLCFTQSQSQCASCTTKNQWKRDTIRSGRRSSRRYLLVAIGSVFLASYLASLYLRKYLSQPADFNRSVKLATDLISFAVLVVAGIIQKRPSTGTGTGTGRTSDSQGTQSNDNAPLLVNGSSQAARNSRKSVKKLCSKLCSSIAAPLFFTYSSATTSMWSIVHPATNANANANQSNLPISHMTIANIGLLALTYAVGALIKFECRSETCPKSRQAAVSRSSLANQRLVTSQEQDQHLSSCSHCRFHWSHPAHSALSLVSFVIEFFLVLLTVALLILGGLNNNLSF